MGKSIARPGIVSDRSRSDAAVTREQGRRAARQLKYAPAPGTVGLAALARELGATLVGGAR